MRRDTLNLDLREVEGPVPDEAGRFWVCVTEQQACDLARGYVASSIKASLSLMLDQAEEDERYAAVVAARAKKKAKR